MSVARTKAEPTTLAAIGPTAPGTTEADSTTETQTTILQSAVTAVSMTTTSRSTAATPPQSDITTTVSKLQGELILWCIVCYGPLSYVHNSWSTIYS